MDLLTTFKNAIVGSSYPMATVKSTVDGRPYRVRALPDRQEAANLLAQTRLGLCKLADHLTARYPDKPQVIQLKSNFRCDDSSRFIEATPDAQHTSYSVNKGETIYLCLRQRGGGAETLTDPRVLMFVAIHEMSHVLTKSIGHTPEFWNNMGWLIKEAEATGVYSYIDFKSHPVTYCGLTISDSPRYDPSKDGTDFSIGKMGELIEESSGGGGAGASASAGFR